MGHAIILWLMLIISWLTTASCKQYLKLNSTNPIKVIRLQKLANQSILNRALVIEVANGDKGLKS